MRTQDGRAELVRPLSQQGSVGSHYILYSAGQAGPSRAPRPVLRRRTACRSMYSGDHGGVQYPGVPLVGYTRVLYTAHGHRCTWTVRPSVSVELAVGLETALASAAGDQNNNIINVACRRPLGGFSGSPAGDVLRLIWSPAGDCPRLISAGRLQATVRD